MFATKPTCRHTPAICSVMNRPSICAKECELAHTLNNKISVIMAMCELLSEHLTDPTVTARLRVIHEAAKTMGDEINKPLNRSAGA
jgi:hypothetical protein